MVRVARSKHTIYSGFEWAIADEVIPKDNLGILVDEQFGIEILRRCQQGLHYGCFRGEERPGRIRIRIWR